MLRPDLIVPPVPSLVQALADKVKMNPIAWHILPDKVIIIFEQGPKLTFDRDDIEVKVAIAPPVKKVIAPAIQKLPVKRQAKKH